MPGCVFMSSIQIQNNHLINTRGSFSKDLHRNLLNKIPDFSKHNQIVLGLA